ncbi:MAG: Gfo/Idh/MocA family oxidoreductase [Alphaproteobacteria bacterium]|nr:Gfo/Idh/MocA family oxidoreductase [Alphaproteobacteria bacterium]
MDEVRVAVIGVGHFGRLHAEKLRGLPGARLVGVVDADRERGASVAGPLGVEAFTALEQVPGKVDAVSIAVPTRAHFDVASACLEAGIHCLIEKPIAETVEQAAALVRLAKERDRILQVGHLVRFDAAREAMTGVIDRPMFIECHRIAPFKPRGTDVSVILDLMIHDIDLVLDLVGQPIVDLDAVGVPVLGDNEDIANARLVFEGGCVANVTASRISMKSERTLRLFQKSGYGRVDFIKRKFTWIKRGGPVVEGFPNFQIEERDLPETDPLRLEIASFVDCVRSGKPPLVDGEAGLRALEAALRITKALQHWAEKVG